jgi:hypothetical protein
VTEMTKLKEDMLIEQAMSLLKDHLQNHPTREGNSVGYRIEQAIFILKEAQAECLAAYKG